jgi:beta-glucosidase
MNKVPSLLQFLLVVCLTIIVSCTTTEIPPKTSPVFKPEISFEEATAWADSIVSLLTLEEKISLIGGDRNFFTNAIPRLNIPGVMMTDATQGIHLREGVRRGFKYDKVLEKSTAFPCPLLLASTWNKELAGKYAQAVGEECRAGGMPVLLGPGMNMYRISQCGRNFEYFGEDPFLAARMIENYVVGLQNTGIIATLKHFVANNTDYYRRKSNSIMNERALNEIYTVAFKAGIDAGAMAVMTSYNQLNGEWTGESHNVINDLLREQLGFKWFVMTDWTSVYDGVKVITSGQDLEMPFRKATADVDHLIANNTVKESDIDRMVTSLLRTLYAAKAFDHTKQDSSFMNFEKHEQLALETAREGIVLLRNENNILPVKSTVKSILVTGEYAWMYIRGGGAASVQGYNFMVLADAMFNEFGDRIRSEEFPTDEAVSGADMVVLNIGTYDSEGRDRPFDLPDSIETQILKIAGLNKNTVVVVNSGSGINMSRWYNKVAAIIYAWYPGQNGATAVAEIIAGKVNPSGKLPITIEKDFKDSPGYGYIPEGEELYTRRNSDEEKTRAVYDVNYKEGIFIGYRWYDKQQIEPLYPFGYGLSYTTFNYNDFALSAKKIKPDQAVEVIFTIENTGKIPGTEIAQIYVHDVKSSIERPVKELKGFEKINLQPGEKKEVRVILDKRDFSFWSPATKQWTVEPGKFEILVGSSSDSISGKMMLTIQ